ncbi:hypothetical protein LKL90_04695 [Bacillus mobilis]|uniref:hypothetical protein n=1 Tax=Bacillus mobilis TaxID=2026190 RepID=UPI001E35BBBB|nr:hypothetical protein [Bacillus mobilis]MCC2459664.1 hypothetical protein [Bacillus mobilis]
MKIEVSEKTKRFYLAFDTWVAAVGHEIKIGKYQFCAVPTSKGVNISEVTSGAKVLYVPMSVELYLLGSTKEGFVKVLEKYAKIIKEKIEKENNFDELITSMQQKSVSKLGEMPLIESFDVDWILAESSGVLH